MGTIFAAYGGGSNRNRVAAVAAEQAATSDHDLLVYHIMEDREPSAREIREEIERVVHEIDEYVVYDVEIETGEYYSETTHISRQRQLVDRLEETDRDVEYVVMGEIERPPLETVTHSSMTEAVLNHRLLPVLLVPI